MIAHRARKRFGQHFLRDPTIVRRIVATVDPKPYDILVEIGPGEGVLTRELAPRVDALHAVELDRDLVTHLKAALGAQENLYLYNADALTFDFCRLAVSSRKLRLIGNLPYNVSTPLLFRMLEQTHCIEDMCFMLQREVVDRVCAIPNTKAYGRLSVMIQWHCAVQRLFDIKPGAFNPRPKVDSAIVRLRPYASPPSKVIDEIAFARLVGAAFVQRRKTLRNALKSMLRGEQISALGIDPGRRGETLTLEEFALLSDAVTRGSSR